MLNIEIEITINLMKYLPSQFNCKQSMYLCLQFIISFAKIDNILKDFEVCFNRLVYFCILTILELYFNYLHDSSH